LFFVALAVGAVVHEQVEAVELVFGDGLVDGVSDVAHVGATGEVGEDDVLGRAGFEELDDVIEVEVLADVGAGAVAGLEEGALGDEDLGVEDVVAFEVLAPGGVAGVAEEGDGELSGDFGAGLLEFLEFFLGQADVFVAELGALLDDDIAHGGDGVVGVEGAEEVGGLDWVLLVVVEGDDLVGGALGLDGDPCFHDVFEGGLEVGVADGGAGAHALEVALGEVVGQGGGMVHMAVGEGDEG